MEDPRLKKAQAILDALDEGGVGADEVSEALEVIVGATSDAVDAVVKMVDRTESRFAKETEQLEGRINSVDQKVDSHVQSVRKDLEKQINEISLTPGDPGNDADPEVVAALVLERIKLLDPIKAPELSADAVVEKVNGSKKKIRKSQVDGLDDLERMVQAQAVAIPVTTTFVNGKRAKNLSITGATVTHRDDTATITITGGAGAVDSVNGQTGVVVLDTGDISESGNLYFTDERAQDAVGGMLTGGSLVYVDATPLLKLDGDSATPGNSKYYGTNGSGTKGFYNVPGGGTGITRTITTSSGAFTAGATASIDYVYLIAGAHAVALPTAVGNTNRYTFKNNHSANITITPDGVETVEGGATLSLAPQESVDLISNNSNWFVI